MLGKKKPKSSIQSKGALLTELYTDKNQGIPNSDSLYTDTKQKRTGYKSIQEHEKTLF